MQFYDELIHQEAQHEDSKPWTIAIAKFELNSVYLMPKRMLYSQVGLFSLHENGGTAYDLNLFLISRIIKRAQ